MNRSTKIALSLIPVALYIVIIEYVLFAIVKITESDNFIAGFVFETVGIVFLVAVIMAALGLITGVGNIKIGFLVPIITITVLYTALLDLINILGTLTMSGTWFVLLHLLLLFVYLIITIPMLIAGKSE